MAHWEEGGGGVSRGCPEGVVSEPPRHVQEISGSLFDLHGRYEICGLLGTGAYGVVVKAFDHEAQEYVAIKKCVSLFRGQRVALRFLREIKLLQFLNHENVVKMLDIDVPPDLDNFQDLFIVLEMMPTNLHAVIRSSFEYSLEHIQFFFLQLCQAMHYLHSANVLHRDLKSSNILVSMDCDIKLCDFGLARDDASNHRHMTEYMISRYWRPPEILLRDPHYSKAADVWSAGLILLELFNRRPIFRGSDSADQLRLIVDNYWGTPSPEDISEGASEDLVDSLLARPKADRHTIADLIPHSTLPLPPEAEDLAMRMLQFHPDRRITFAEALRHPYFRDLEEMAVNSEETFDTSYEADVCTEEGMRALFLEEVSHFHPEILDTLHQRLLRGEELPLDVDFFPSLQQHLQEVGFSFDEIMGHEDVVGGYAEGASYQLHGGPPLEELGEGIFGGEGEEQGFGAVFQPYHQGQGELQPGGDQQAWQQQAPFLLAPGAGFPPAVAGGGWQQQQQQLQQQHHQEHQQQQQQHFHQNHHQHRDSCEEGADEFMEQDFMDTDS